MALSGIVPLIIILAGTLLLRSFIDNLTLRSGPAALEAKRINTGLQSAIANQRGWVEEPREEFRSGLRTAWNNQIIPARKKLSNLIKGEEIEDRQLEELRLLLDELRTWQFKIVETAHTPSNLPATKYFTEELSPIFEILFTTITEVTNDEKKNDG